MKKILRRKPIFEVSFDESQIFIRRDVKFKNTGESSPLRTQININNLHTAYLTKNPGRKILEISSKSESELGRSLSAFNLMINDEGQQRSMEVSYQASKVFENGGPFIDLLNNSSVWAKSDKRLKQSGKVISYLYKNKSFPIEPKTYFFNWLYVKTLASDFNKHLADQIIAYDAFTDIFYVPNKTTNCQAEAAAIYVSLRNKNLLESALKDEQSFLDIVYKQCIN